MNRLFCCLIISEEECIMKKIIKVFKSITDLTQNSDADEIKPHYTIMMMILTGNCLINVIERACIAPK